MGQNPDVRNLKLTCKSESGKLISGIIFRVSPDGKSPEEAALRKGSVVTLAGKLEIDTYEDPPRPKIIISDILMPEPEPTPDNEIADASEFETQP